MEAEHASLSCIIIDACGDPIAQVAYRCALCRKICDSTTDAMMHYQVEHVDLFKIHMQQQQQAQLLHRQAQNQQRATSINQKGNMSSSSNLRQQHGHIRHAQSGSLLKRPVTQTVSGGSLLKRPAPGVTASSSLLKRASNVMRAHQQQQQHQQQPTSSSAHGRTSSRRIASVNAVNAASSDEFDSIHRPYATTSASRAAKRYGSNLEQQVRQNQSTMGSRSSTRNQTPRHLDRTNQYTANLKAKISAQKADLPKKDGESTTQMTSTPISSLRNMQASEQSSQDYKSNDLNNSSISASNSSNKSNENIAGPEGTSHELNANTPSQSMMRDNSKAYSLRPRSSGKKRLIDL